MKLRILILTAMLLALSLPNSYSRERKIRTEEMVDTIQVNKTPPPPPESDEKVPTLLAAWAPVTIAHSFGIRGGYGFGSIRLEPTKQGKSYSGLINFGVTYRFDVPKQKYVGTIQAELNYIEKGFAYETFSESGQIYSRKYSSIELPVMWQPYIPLSNNGSRFHLNAGPFVSYSLGSTYRLYTEEGNQTIEEGDYYYDTLRDNRWDYGIALGAGFVIAIKRFAISADFRYNIGLGDILKGVTKYPGNPFRSPVDQMNISLGVSFRL